LILASCGCREQGHKVLSAGTPQGALAILKNKPALDLLFTDLDLKGDIQAGINLADEAIKMPSVIALPVV
jgi:hypothetical protein